MRRIGKKFGSVDGVASPSAALKRAEGVETTRRIFLLTLGVSGVAGVVVAARIFFVF